MSFQISSRSLGSYQRMDREDEDIMSKLFSADLDHIIKEIFLNLDPGSLKEARYDR